MLFLFQRGNVFIFLCDTRVQIKENMKLAPTVRTEFDTPRKENLEQILQKSKPTTELNPRQYRENKGRSCGATWPLDKDNDVEVIGR